MSEAGIGEIRCTTGSRTVVSRSMACSITSMTMSLTTADKGTSGTGFAGPLRLPLGFKNPRSPVLPVGSTDGS